MIETNKLIKISNKFYHGESEHIGHSSLLRYLKSPRYVKWWNDLPADADEKKSTAAMQFGSAAHSFVLEPETFEAEVFVMNELMRPEPDKTFVSTKNREWKANIIEANSNKTIITNEDYQTLCDMKAVLFADKRIQVLLSGGQAEMSLFMEFKGVKTKIRCDYIKNILIKNAPIIDYKTTDDASPEGFNKAMANYNYHVQAAYYLDILNQFQEQDRQFIFIVQEKKPPFIFGIYRCSISDIEAGRVIYEKLLDLHKWCIEENDWKGMEIFAENPQGIIETRLPAYSANKELNLYY